MYRRFFQLFQVSSLRPKTWDLLPYGTLNAVSDKSTKTIYRIPARTRSYNLYFQICKYKFFLYFYNRLYFFAFNQNKFSI